MTDTERWPSIPVADWQDTRDTLHLYTQVVGKVRLANEPRVNHWWNIPLYVSARGLTTSLMPHPTGPAFQSTSTSPTTASTSSRWPASVVRSISSLAPSPTSTRRRCRCSSISAWAPTSGRCRWSSRRRLRFLATESTPATTRMPFGGSGSAGEMERVFKLFRTRFVGKSSPVHVFWGSLDVALTRFSGRTAPPHPGGAPNCGPHVMWEAYSHEVSSCGYWPGPPEKRACSTPTPTRNRRDTARGRSLPRAQGGTTVSPDSSCPTSSFVPPRTPKNDFSTFYRAPTKQRR